MADPGEMSTWKHGWYQGLRGLPTWPLNTHAGKMPGLHRAPKEEQLHQRWQHCALPRRELGVYSFPQQRPAGAS